MRKHFPLNSNGAEDAGQLPWKDGVPSTGVEGSYPGQALFTDCEAEILSAIDAAGLVRSGLDLTQLIQAFSRGIWLGLFGGTATALTAALPNSVVLPSLQVGMRVRGIAASDYTGPGGTLAITGINAAGTTVSYPIVASDGTALPAGAWKAGQFLTFDIDASSNARLSGGASTSGSISQAQAAKSLFNVIPFQNTTRTSMNATGANVLVTPWNGFIYNKKSPTSNILIIGNFQTFTPGSFGCTRVRFTVGNQIFDTGLSNGVLQSASGAAGSLAFGNSPVIPIRNLPVGAQSCAMSFFRTDGATWTTVFNPTASDVADYPPTNTVTLLLMEVEP
ncbi:hypothetical protein [Methylobacterium sp. D48H]